MPKRFDVDYLDPALSFDPLIDEVFEELQSSFIEMPRGDGFTDYETFEKGYQSLKRFTNDFTVISSDTVESSIAHTPISFVVFRAILGLTPPEWAYVTTATTGVNVSQNVARTIDKNVRRKPFESKPKLGNTLTEDRMKAMIRAGVNVLTEGASKVSPGMIHRLDKVDTKSGILSVQHIAMLGVPYAVLLYERILGRPFASHRDAVSELVGLVVENAIKDVLTAARVSFRPTGRAERIPGFDQAPDFIIPDEFNPVAVIEAKLTEDDGTARDKVSRVQRLRTLRDDSGKNYDVIACIAGRGFKVRREDMRRMLQATDGKVFTLETMHLLVDSTRISEYRTR